VHQLAFALRKPLLQQALKPAVTRPSPPLWKIKESIMAYRDKNRRRTAVWAIWCILADVFK